MRLQPTCRSGRSIGAVLLGAVTCMLLLAGPHSVLAGCGGGDGLGGTGRSEPTRPEGAPSVRQPPGDGTGDGLGGTGLVGTVDAFGSICVCGEEVEYEPDTPVEWDGRPARTSDLALGQQVRVEAAERAGELRAERIEIQSSIVGPIQRIGPGQDELWILGQRVSIGDAVRIPEAPDGARGALAVGVVVRVSGQQRRDRSWRATRIEPAPEGVVSRVSGVAFPSGVERPTGEASIRLGELRVTIPEGLPFPEAGETVVVVGSLEGELFRAAELTRQPAVPFEGRRSRVLVEGYVTFDREAALRLAGARIALEPDARGRLLASLDGTPRVRIDSRVAGGTLRVTRLEIQDVPGRWDRIDGALAPDARATRRGDGTGPETEPPGEQNRPEPEGPPSVDPGDLRDDMDPGPRGADPMDRPSPRGMAPMDRDDMDDVDTDDDDLDDDLDMDDIDDDMDDDMDDMDDDMDDLDDDLDMDDDMDVDDDMDMDDDMDDD